ncbi:MAG: peptidylprolyl isomerase [Anaerolineaceae bacterium]|nr:peptidylprolyl isomerase [Anaerolineaceae bacterium]
MAENIVVTLAYELTVDGKVVDSSEDGEPIIFLQGAGQVIPGLEKALVGMKSGESKKIVVSAAEGYGEKDEDAVVEVPREEFPSDFPLAVGLEITVQTNEESDDDDTDFDEDEDFEDEDDMMEAVITDFNDETVTLDFNHPLAGKELTFNITVVDLRYASEEEIEHGHVHGDDFDFYFDDEDFEDDDDESSDNHHH